MTTTSNANRRVCPGCDVVAVETFCRVCKCTTYGNGSECWPCHDANAHRPRTGNAQAAANAATPDDFRRMWNHPGFMPRRMSR